MRSYPTNSPEAAARLVAVLMLSDGQLSAVELDVLEREALQHPLGVDRPAMLTVLQHLCEDLLFTEHLTWAQACQVPEPTLRQMLDEVTAPDLRERVLRLALAVIYADRHLADGEFSAIARTLRYWDVDAHSLRPLRTAA